MISALALMPRRILVRPSPSDVAIVAASLFAWIALLRSDAALALPSYCLAGANLWNSLGAGLDTAIRLNPLPQLLLSWLLMLCAMMLPFARVPNGSAAALGFPAVAAHIAGYMAVWVVALLPITAVAAALRLATGPAALPPLLIALGVALAWQGTAAKAHCLNRSHRAPASRDDLFAGVRNGLASVCACWAMMALPFVVTGAAHLAAMVVVTAAMVVERLRSPARGNRPILWSGAFLAFAAGGGVLAI